MTLTSYDASGSGTNDTLRLHAIAKATAPSIRHAAGNMLNTVPPPLIHLHVASLRYQMTVTSKDGWGRDVEVLWYGGNQWANMSGNNVLWGGMDDERFRNLLNILTINRNASVVIDSDDPKTAQRKHKDRLSTELSQLEPPRRVWMTGPPCIEFYIKKQSSDAGLQKVFENCRSLDARCKVQRAREYVAYTESRRLEEIIDKDTDIGSQLRATYEDIRSWAG